MWIADLLDGVDVNPLARPNAKDVWKDARISWPQQHGEYPGSKTKGKETQDDSVPVYSSPSLDEPHESRNDDAVYCRQNQKHQANLRHALRLFIFYRTVTVWMIWSIWARASANSLLGAASVM